MVEEVKKEDKEVLEGKPYAVLGYLWILCLVPLILKKENKFALFHAKQGLVLFIAELAIGFIGIIPFLGWLIFFFGSVVLGLLSLLGIIQALMGNYWKMPVIGDFAEKINF
jgi:fumarate reductase subunit D